MPELEGEIVKVAKIDYHTAEITVRVNIRDRPSKPDPEGKTELDFARLDDAFDKQVAKWQKLQKALQEMGLRKVKMVFIENTED